jgi:hypothetical protein
MYVYCVYPTLSKKSENLSDLNKKDRNKRHSSPFINVVKGVFFVVRVTIVPVSYLSAPSAVHSYRVPGKFIRLIRIKQKFIRMAYVYCKCTDCRINKFIFNYFFLMLSYVLLWRPATSPLRVKLSLLLWRLAYITSES